MTFHDELNEIRRRAGLPLKEREEILYHGSDHPHLETYDLSKVRTASHIYVTNDVEAAQKYGKYLYQATPIPGLKYFDMNPENMGPEEYQVVKRVYADLKDDWFQDYTEVSLDDFIELVTSSKLYDYDTKGRLQDDVMDMINYYGFDVVIFADARPGGGWAESFVFFDPAHLRFSPIQGGLTEGSTMRMGAGKYLLVNPNKQQFYSIAQKVQQEVAAGKRAESLVKGLLDPETGDFFIWNPMDATHGEIDYMLHDQRGSPDEEAWLEVTKEPDTEVYDDEGGYIPYAYGYTKSGTEHWIAYPHLLNHPSIKTAIG